MRVSWRIVYVNVSIRGDEHESEDKAYHHAGSDMGMYPIIDCNDFDWYEPKRLRKEKASMCHELFRS